MRALLVVNPKATTTSERGRNVLVRALRSEVRLRVAYTRRRGHAAALARQAAIDGYDLVVTLGGDGTVNEVVNGMLGEGPNGTPPPNPPALAVVPGGSTNVFARALGMPKDSVEGTGVILEALYSGRVRTVGLGRADGRYFTFCAGMGIDAEVVRKVERARLRGRSATSGRYLRSAVTQYFMDSDRRNPTIALERPGEEVETGIATVIVQNTAPWTFIGDRPLHPCPDASFDTGLDLLALRALRVPSTVRTVTQFMSRHPDPRGRQVLRLHDLSEFTLRSSRPQAFQVDGEYLGERLKVTFNAAARAIRVYC